MIQARNPEIEELLDTQCGVATSGQIPDSHHEASFSGGCQLRCAGKDVAAVYCRGEATVELRLHGLDLSRGDTIPVCLGTAAMLIRQGLSTRAIAERLTLSVRTVEGHICRAMTKTGAADRDELAAMLPSSHESTKLMK
jgi:hypothetical protein